MERVLLLCVPAMFGSVTSCTVLKWCFAFVFWGGVSFLFCFVNFGGLGPSALERGHSLWASPDRHGK